MEKNNSWEPTIPLKITDNKENKKGSTFKIYFSFNTQIGTVFSLEELESHWDSLSGRDLRMFQFGVFSGFSDALIILEGGESNVMRS